MDRIIRAINGISRVCAEVSGWLIVPMMLSIFLDAVLRSMFGIALAGIIELNSLLLVTLIYMGLAGAQSSGAHFRVTLISNRMHPTIRSLVSLFGYLFVLFALVSLLLFTANAAWFSFQRNEVGYGLIDFPIWPSRVLIAIGFFVLLVQYLADGVLLLTRKQDPFSRTRSEIPPHQIS